MTLDKEISIRIKSFNESARVFGFRGSKEELLGKSINDWIWENLEGRFWVGDYYYVDNSPSAHVIMSKAAAFERAAEASYFALAIDQINIFNLS